MAEPSTDRETALRHAHAAYRDLRLDDAFETYRTLSAADPRDYDAQIGLARTLIRQRKQDEALAAAQRCVELDPTRYEGFAALGVLHFLTDELASASAAVQHAIGLAPDEPDPRLTLAQIHADQKQFPDAHAELDRARESIMRIADDALRLELQAAAGHSETYILLTENKPEDARLAAQTVITLEDANPHAACLAYSNLGILDARARRYSDAIDNLQRAIDMNPYLEGAGTTLGRLLILRGQAERAAQVLGKVVENPNLHGGSARMAYGMALARTGRRAEALEQYRQALAAGLRGTDKLIARWQTIWLDPRGRYVLIGLALAAVAAWVLFAQLSPQMLTLLAILVVIVLLQRASRGRGARQ
ncbi:MAG: tetratricopeptide repeat protein [Chloroflexi bacterium]|nr:tetratricopeptide repeat protein [Chloroflexota bacterium]